MEIKTHYASFSEAIREGAKLRPQAFGRLFTAQKSCALGAGVESLFGGLPPSAERYNCLHEMLRVYPYLIGVDADCPRESLGCGHVGHPIHSQISHLNDEHGWSREQIADWLETEEEKLGYVTLIETEPTKNSERGGGVRSRGNPYAL